MGNFSLELWVWLDRFYDQITASNLASSFLLIKIWTLGFEYLVTWCTDLLLTHTYMYMYFQLKRWVWWNLVGQSAHQQIRFSMCQSTNIAAVDSLVLVRRSSASRMCNHQNWMPSAQSGNTPPGHINLKFPTNQIERNTVADQKYLLSINFIPEYTTRSWTGYELSQNLTSPTLTTRLPRPQNRELNL